MMHCASKPETRSSFMAPRVASAVSRCSSRSSAASRCSPPPRAIAPAGVDAVLAFAGGDSLERCVEALRAGGRIAYPYGVKPDPRPRDDTAAVIRYNAVPGPQEFERLNRAIGAVKLKVPIEAEFPLAQADKAQERVEAGHILGKIVLRIR
ncbi:MAG: zinc-binding dehydrogenase [Gammaproteobacteria bacterium]|nr:MAG: zinc-binding dehydrogenase [Gammaproteobacteria bacterium]